MRALEAVNEYALAPRPRSAFTAASQSAQRARSEASTWFPSQGSVQLPDKPAYPTSAVSETRRLIADLDQRIARQTKRIEKVLFNHEGPVDDMQALLADMIAARAVMQSQLESLVK